MPQMLALLILASMLLLLSPLTSANLRVYKDCHPTSRNYISNRLEDALANIELVVRARGSIEDKLEVKHFGVLDQAPKEKVTDLYTRALHHRPTLLFTCPERGSELEKLCQASKWSSTTPEPDNPDDRIGISLMDTKSHGLVACPAPEAGADFAFANKVAIVNAIIEATLEEQPQDHAGSEEL